jgi:hypothetical protein
MLSQAPKDGPRDFRPGGLGLCARLDFECPAINLSEGRGIVPPSRRAPLAHQAREFLLHCVGYRFAVTRSKTVQHQLLDMDLDGVRSDQ